MIIHLERKGISSTRLAHYKGEALGRAGWEWTGLQSYFSLYKRQKTGWGREVSSLLRVGFSSLWSWPPFPDVAIVLPRFWGLPSSGRHLGLGSFIPNSCWEQLGLPYCLSVRNQVANASVPGFLTGCVWSDNTAEHEDVGLSCAGPGRPS